MWLVGCGTLPVVASGLLLSGGAEDRLRTPGVAAAMLALVALAFFVVERFGRRTRGEESLRFGEAAVIGCAQALALVPGVSRSGATIATGMAFGLRRDEAARFSFLLGVPAILAAAASEGLPLLKVGLGRDEAWLFAVGALTSAVVGYFTVKYFIRFLGRHSLAPFAWYRLALAALFVTWWLVGSR